MLPLSSPKGAEKCKMAVFCLKVHFSRRKYLTKFLCVNTVCDKVVRHSLAYLTVQKLVVDVPLYLKFWPKLTYLLQKCRFPIDIRS